MHSCSSGDLVEVRFDGLIQEDADYPPVDAEVLWARPISSTVCILDNIPFYVRGVAYLDTVEAAPAAEDGILTFQYVVARSGHSTYRIYWSDKTSESDKACAAFLRQLAIEGCGIERGVGRLYAIDIPPSVSVHHIYKIFEQMERAGILDFEEGYFFSGVPGRAEPEENDTEPD